MINGVCKTRLFGDDESDGGVDYMVISSTFDDNGARHIWETIVRSADRYRCGHEHDCCACFFHGALYIKRVGKRALLLQNWGINI